MMRLNQVKNTAGAVAIAAALAWTQAAVRAASPALEMARQLNQAFIEVADQVSPAVVVIRVAHKPSYINLDDEDAPFWDLIPRQFRKQLEEQREKQRQEKRDNPHGREPVFDGQGSGIVLTEDGYIMTNRHVVDGADRIKVRLKDGTEFDAEVRGVDPQSDVAVIRIDPKGKKLTVAKLGDSEKARVGEFAIAIGAPFDLDYSVTFGHVSAKGRSWIIPDQTMDQDFIQTDASINPGNSGGPLVNIYGEVIGINTLIRGLRTGIGFAIPVNLAKEVADNLIKEGKYVRSWLGIGIKALRDDPDFREMVPGVQDGVIVTLIQPEGPAAKSDLRPSDVITSVDGKPVGTAQQLKSEIRSKKIGQTLTLDVYRKDRNVKVKVKTDAWPDETTLVVNKKPAPAEEEIRTFGLTLQTLTKELADQFGVDKIEGVIVTEVERGSVAERKGIRPGDIITDVNQKSVTTPKQFREAVKTGDAKKGVIVNFTSRGTSKFELLKESGD
jgi:serine protease Do